MNRCQGADPYCPVCLDRGAACDRHWEEYLVTRATAHQAAVDLRNALLDLGSALANLLRLERALDWLERRLGP